MSDAAVASIVGGVITIVTLVVGFLTLWVKLKYGVTKLEEAAKTGAENKLAVAENTQLTRRNTSAVDNVASQLNGALDDKVTRIIKDHTEPLVKAFEAHNRQDQANMDRIETAIKELSTKLDHK